MLDEKDLTYLEKVFDGRYRKIEDCNDIEESTQKEIEGVKMEGAGMREAFATVSTKLNAVIAILCAVAGPLLATCVQILFGGKA